MNPALVLGGLQLVGGLFSANRERQEARDAPRRNIVSQAQGVREAAERYGFNPLTMLQYGQPGGAMGGGAPLASAQLISDGLADVTDVLSGDAERRRVASELQNDLLRIQIDQLRGAVARPSAASSVGSGAAVLGGRSVEAAGPSVLDQLWNPAGAMTLSGERLGVPDIASWPERLDDWAAPYVSAARGALFGWMDRPPTVPDSPSGAFDADGLRPYEAGLSQARSPAEVSISDFADATRPRPRSPAFTRAGDGRPGDHLERAHSFGLPFGFFRQ